MILFAIGILKKLNDDIFKIFAADGRPTFTTTPKPAQLIYSAKMKFIQLGSFQLPAQGTRYLPLAIPYTGTLWQR